MPSPPSSQERAPAAQTPPSGHEESLRRLAGLVGARRLAVLVHSAGSVPAATLDHDPPWPATSLSAWLHRDETLVLPRHTLLEAKNLFGASELGLASGTRLILLDDEDGPLGAVFFEPDAGRRTSLPAEALELSRWIARTTRLMSYIDSERRLWEGLMKVVGQGFIAVDGAGVIVRYEGNAQQILGFAPSDALGRSCDEVFRSVDLDESPLRAALANDLRRVELYVVRSDGREVSVSAALNRILDDEGRLLGALALFRDTTEERALEENARRKDRLASIGELAAAVAHEIRNPLTGIQTCAQILEDRMREQPKGLRQVEIILKEGQRLNRIVDSVLRFAHPGRPQLRKASISDCARRVVELESGHLQKAGISAQVTDSADVPAIYLDTDQITQVLLNLIRNAADAMPEGGTVRMTIEKVKRQGHTRKGVGRRTSDRIRYPAQSPMRDFVRVTIRDTGSGIPESLQPKVFDPFVTTRSGGTGLGLSICQSIVQEHGGFIQLHSVPGRGTTVEVDLPVERRISQRRSDKN